MPIEFTCTTCNKKLRVADQAAGKQARCPSCSAVLTVPAASPTATPGPVQPTSQPQTPPSQPQSFPSDQQQPFGTQQQPFGAPQQPFGETQQPFGAPQQPQQPFGTPAKPAPSSNPYASPNIGAAPTSFGTGAVGGDIRNQKADAGQIIGYAFEVWKANLGILIGISLVVGFIPSIVNQVFAFVQGMLFGMEQEELGMVVAVVGFLVTQMISLFLQIGQMQVTLSLIRGQRAQFADLFQGGPRFLPTLGIFILLYLAIGAGFVLLVIPGIILMLMWWPAYFLVIDNKSTVMDSFSKAQMVSQGNWATAFLLWLASFGIMLAGVIACCIGLIFAAPLVTTMWCVAYLVVSGQLPANAVYQKTM